MSISSFRSSVLFIFVLSILVLSSTDAFSATEEVEELVRTAKEGAAVQKKKGQWVPVPIPMSNPTVGTGLQFVLMYLHGDKKPGMPNRTSGLAGMYTDNDSWFTGGFHDGYLSTGDIRIQAYGGYGNLNLKYYGVGEDSPYNDDPLSYKFVGSAGMVRLLKRLPYSENWFAGVEFVYLNTETIFDLGIASPALPETAGQITNAGLGPVLSYDSRDDNYYPTRGQNLEMLLLSYRDNWGGDLDYRKLDLNVSHFQLLVPKLVLALHADYKASEGDVPFFDLPSLEMRGFPVGRYRDQYTFSTHAESRYKFLPRWGGNLFVESGWYGDEPEELFAGETVVSYGGGVRWQVTADEKIHLGLLMAFSGGDKGFYITVGEKF